MSAAPTCLHHILVCNAAVSAVQTSWSEYISYSVSAVIELAIMDDTSRPIWVTIATDSNAIAEAKAKLINGGAYCHSCFSISKNFTTVFPNAVLQRQGKEPVVEWEIRLEDLVTAVEEGCQFCSFMACRFFDDPCFTFMYGKATSSTRVACCSKASRVDTTDFVLEALKNIRKFFIQTHLSHLSCNSYDQRTVYVMMGRRLSLLPIKAHLAMKMSNHCLDTEGISILSSTHYPVRHLMVYGLMEMDMTDLST